MPGAEDRPMLRLPPRVRTRPARALPGKGTSMSPATYEIHLRGDVPPELLADLPGATCTEAESETLLLPLDVAQDGLHQLARRLRDLGIALLELRHVSSTGSPRQARDAR